MYSSKTTRHAIVQSDTTVISPPLRAIEVYTAGTLVVRQAGDGEDITVVFPSAANGGSYPYTFECNIDIVYAATTIADAALLGLRQ